VKTLKTATKKTLITLLLLSLLLVQSGCSTRESVDVVLYYTKLYAMAHGFWQDDGTPGGKVDALGLYGYILWGGRPNPRSNPDHPEPLDITFRDKTPYEAAVISVFFVTGFDEKRNFWGH
jgi:hypothetical protein